MRGASAIFFNELSAIIIKRNIMSAYLRSSVLKLVSFLFIQGAVLKAQIT
jgi:hypothetical protein